MPEFRFKNALDVLQDWENEVPNIVHYLSKPGLLPWGSGGSPWNDMNYLISARYILGASLDAVYEAVHWKALLGQRMLDELLEHFTLETAQEVSYFSHIETVDCIGCSAILNNANLIAFFEKRPQDLLNFESPEPRLMSWPKLELVLLLSQHANSLEEQVEKVFESCADFPQFDFENRLLAIARGEVEKYNSLLQKKVQEKYGTERSRLRKREVPPMDLLACEELFEATFAVHCGIPITFRDSCMPFWDFPIWNNQEYKKLLPQRPGK